MQVNQPPYLFMSWTEMITDMTFTALHYGPFYRFDILGTLEAFANMRLARAEEVAEYREIYAQRLFNPLLREIISYGACADAICVLGANVNVRKAEAVLEVREDWREWWEEQTHVR
jgi:hypothetical protein